MFSFGYETLLWSLVTIWMFSSQSTEGANISCGSPPCVSNAQARYQSTKVGAIVTYVCNQGYSLSGASKRTCRANGQWDKVTPNCFKTCPLPDMPFSSYIAQPSNYNRTYKTGDTITLACKKGFEKQSGSIPVRVCINGRWKKFRFKCKEKPDRRCVELLRGLLKNVPRNTMIAINIRLSKARYRCHEGFELVGKERTCKEGRWVEKEEPKCLDESEELWVNGTDICDYEMGKRRKGRAINLDSDGGLDLVFVVDGSDSVKRDGFQIGLKFAKELIRTIATSKRRDGTRLALVTFGTEAKVEFNFGDAKVDTLEKAIEAIEKVAYIGGATASSLALEKVRKTVVQFARWNSKRVIIFITDGKSNINCSPSKEAKYLRENERFEIYAIGVGRKVRVRNLQEVASADNNDNHVISLRRYKILQEAIKKVVEMKIDYSPCGESPVHFRDRIVGGNNSKRGWWPWQVGIYKHKYNGETDLYCAGSLISARWVLTVAHCFYFRNHFTNKFRLDDNARRYTIRAGDHNLAKWERSEQEIILEQIFVHKNYQHRKFVNDIALVKLSRKVNLGKFVRTVCLPKMDEGDLVIPTKYGIVAGWGATKALKLGESAKKADRYSKVLRYSAYTVQSNRVCSRTQFTFNSTVSFCAGDGKGGNDTCQGDNGGAFVREARRGDGYRWVATGLVSWGEGCAQKDKYTYYTRVYPFIDWIKKTMDENTNPEDGA